MFNSTGRNGFGFGSGHRGSVTIIDRSVRISHARRAQITLFVVGGIVAVLAAVVLSDRLHPILALLTGGLLGVVVGGLAGAVVIAWPVLRVFWHWSVEITVAVTLLWGWMALAEATSTVVTLLVVALVVGVPAAWPAARRRISAWAWCVIVRHRLRLCFAAFIHAAGTVQAGTRPLILLARPTPAGERVWVWLRPGLSLSDLEGRMDKLAVACWAKDVRVAREKSSSAALIRVDITRRNPLRAKVSSPLTALLTEMDLDEAIPSGPPPAVGLDLADVPDPKSNQDNASVRDRKPRDAKPTAEVPNPPFDPNDAFI